jgi:hypothetical protein
MGQIDITIWFPANILIFAIFLGIIGFMLVRAIAQYLIKTILPF